MVISNQDYSKIRYAVLDQLWAMFRSNLNLISDVTKVEDLPAARAEVLGKVDLGFQAIRENLSNYAGFLPFISDLEGDLQNAFDAYLQNINDYCERYAYKLLKQSFNL